MNLRSLAALVIGLTCLGCDSGQVAPFELYSLDGKQTYGLDTYKGKVVVLDFWATWCGPCKQIQPAIRGWAEQYADKGVTVLGVTDEAPALVSDFVQRSPLGYEAVIDRGDRTQAEFHIEGFPTLVILGKDGSIAYQGTPFETEKVAGILASLTKAK